MLTAQAAKRDTANVRSLSASNIPDWDVVIAGSPHARFTCFSSTRACQRSPRYSLAAAAPPQQHKRWRQRASAGKCSGFNDTEKPEVAQQQFRCINELDAGYGHMTPSANEPSQKICDWFLACFTCGMKLLEHRYAQVWIIAKTIKESPVGWFL